VLQGITVGAYTLGCFFGAVATIWIGNPLGRRRSIFLGSAIMIVGAIIMTASFSLPQFVVARVITGYVEARMSSWRPRTNWDQVSAMASIPRLCPLGSLSAPRPIGEA